jgi:hypothetical protein
VDRSLSKENDITWLQSWLNNAVVVQSSAKQGMKYKISALVLCKFVTARKENQSAVSGSLFCENDADYETRARYLASRPMILVESLSRKRTRMKVPILRAPVNPPRFRKTEMCSNHRAAKRQNSSIPYEVKEAAILSYEVKLYTSVEARADRIQQLIDFADFRFSEELTRDQKSLQIEFEKFRFRRPGLRFNILHSRIE